MAYDDMIARGKTGNMIPPEYYSEVIESAREDKRLQSGSDGQL